MSECPHKILKSLWIHSGSCHIAAVGMPADMGRDVRKLYAEDVIVALDCMLETVFPVQGYKRQAPVISEKVWRGLLCSLTLIRDLICGFFSSGQRFARG